MRKILLALIGIILIAILGIGGLYYHATRQGKIYQSSEQQVFTVESGESKREIITHLYDKHLISNKLYMLLYLHKHELPLYAGDFGLSESMTDKEVFEIVTNPKSNIDLSRQFLIAEGSTLDTIAGDLAKFTTADDTKQEVLNYWSDPKVLNKIIDNYDFVTDDILDSRILFPLEGYFYPATYKIADDASLEQITKLFLDTMESHLDGVKVDGYSTHQILTLASIIERETLVDSDKPIAAGVFYNRLDQGMKLQSDITVLYAMQKHKEQVLYDDLKYKSPYNTYLHEGLPPGPISTVSEADIDAVANPNNNDYLYFFADQDTGKLHFSKTMSEHSETANKYAWEFTSSSN